jgi:hypothetical protein
LEGLIIRFPRRRAAAAARVDTFLKKRLEINASEKLIIGRNIIVYKRQRLINY